LVITADDVKRLRERTGAGIMDSKRALEQSEGDIERAIAWLREQGLASAAKKADRAAREGMIAAYVHHGDRIGVLLELNCETDFVARTDDFRDLARELAMHVAGWEPRYVSREEVPADDLAAQRAQFADEAAQEGRPADRIDAIVDGKLNKWLESVCLLEQPFRGDTERRIGDLIKEKIAVLGENIKVARFARLAVGETAAPDEEAA
jgi:elongation factor Ts